MKSLSTKAWLTAVVLALTVRADAGVMRRGRVQLICHRTANRDAPENTLESLALAARMGCDIVEVDVRMTADGRLVLNHDGMLERLTDGMGDVETTSFDELEMYDYGSWMGQRFAGMRIPLFTDALRVAREQGIALDLDIKEKGEDAAIYGALEREGMLERVIFGGDPGDSTELRKMYPAANADPVAWFGPEPSAAEVRKAHAEGKFVVANFSENAHQMDLVAMRAAVVAGVDALNVDYPRLGADAVGRPVEQKLAALAASARLGPVAARCAAVREIGQYIGFPTQALLAELLLDPNQMVSRAAAVALVGARPATPATVLIEALKSTQTSARTNAAWALGMIHAPAVPALLVLLRDQDAVELREVLLALSRCPGEVPAEALMPLLSSSTPVVQAAAALALVRHQPVLAEQELPKMIDRLQRHSAEVEGRRTALGSPKITRAEIGRIVDDYREEMKLIHALEGLRADVARVELGKQTTRFVTDYSHVMANEAGNQMWDRLGADPAPLVQALASPEYEVADRAEYILTKGSPALLPALRTALTQVPKGAQARLIRVLAWQGDQAALPLLLQLERTDAKQRPLIDWAIEKINVLSFRTEPSERVGGSNP